MSDIKLTVNELGNGCVIIKWDILPAHHIKKINHYQILLNQVSYKKRIEANVYQVLVKGLCGGRTYDVKFLLFPKKTQSSIEMESRSLVNI